MRSLFCSRTLSFAVSLASFLTGSGCAPDPNGPGSYHALVEAAADAEDIIRTAGGKMERKQYPPGSAWAIDLSSKEINDKTFEGLRKLDQVAELNLSDTNITDAHMKNFSDPEIGGLLVSLDLSKTGISDAGLKEISESIYLTSLNLAETKVTDAGVAEWQKTRAADPRVGPGFKKVKITR